MTQILKPSPDKPEIQLTPEHIASTGRIVAFLHFARLREFQSHQNRGIDQ